MFAGGLLLGLTLLFFAAWLQWTEHRGWPHDVDDTEEDSEYLARRRKSRLVVNVLIFVCGLLILFATFSGAGLIFIACWSLVTMILLVIILMAGLDAFRTHRHHRDKMRRLRQQTLDE